jgi:hypothetical protein
MADVRQKEFGISEKGDSQKLQILGNEGAEENEILLDPREYLALQRELAAEYGANEAMFLQEVLWGVRITGGEPAGPGGKRRYVQLSYEDWQTLFPHLTMRGIKGIVARLRDKGRLVVDNHGSANWYALGVPVERVIERIEGVQSLHVKFLHPLYT